MILFENCRGALKYTAIGGMVLVLLGIGIWQWYMPKNEVSVVPPTRVEVVPELEQEDAPIEETTKEDISFVSPLDTPEKRITKKPFGIRIDPKASPVQPERFSGYHVGTDFEILSGEEDKEVLVRAICSGEVTQVRNASGYGGLLTEECLYQGEKIMVIYGHLDVASISKKVGDTVEKGDVIGQLGDGMSSETDGERKHLHLGVYRGEGVSIRGYEDSESQMRNWMDPCSLGICQ